MPKPFSNRDARRVHRTDVVSKCKTAENFSSRRPHSSFIVARAPQFRLDGRVSSIPNTGSLTPKSVRRDA
ncbi:hypothetical protein AKJ09_09340 [Labilithrix luteola]|uniref:Uncharacterized protein n=1 Tax=Labilithrix luteola TaxID=1391654 RepID=A0A0K1QAG8_9BACT|nr:hypothetical protein AKJ09_09340 [Labilithrix luteola]